MNLKDGYLIYPRLTFEEFKTDSLLWEYGAHGIICDNVEDLISLYGPDLIDFFELNNKTLSIYNVDEDLMLYKQTGPDMIPYFTDNIYEFMRRNGLEWRGHQVYPDTNVEEEIDLEFIRKNAQQNNYVILFIIKLNRSIRGIDRCASEIELDSIYDGIFYENSRYRKFVREIGYYYIYNKDEDKFYKFQVNSQEK